MDNKVKVVEIDQVRGKLIEMLQQVQYLGGLEEKVADHLIANGVNVPDTNVGKWISSKERLPNAFVTVIVQMPLESPLPTVGWGFVNNEGKWYANHFDREQDEVTHWMPLPDPPKGE